MVKEESTDIHCHISEDIAVIVVFYLLKNYFDISYGSVKNTNLSFTINHV